MHREDKSVTKGHIVNKWSADIWTRKSVSRTSVPYRHRVYRNILLKIKSCDIQMKVYGNRFFHKSDSVIYTF
jgi:hypothetical protein